MVTIATHGTKVKKMQLKFSACSKRECIICYYRLWKRAFGCAPRYAHQSGVPVAMPAGFRGFVAQASGY